MMKTKKTDVDLQMVAASDSHILVASSAQSQWERSHRSAPFRLRKLFERLRGTTAQP